MPFSSVVKKKYKFLLPLSWLYMAGVKGYHLLYDLKIRRTWIPGLPVICVGNLSAGGTGKSPMVEYLIRLLQHRFRVATVSRGYRRKTKGFVLADLHTTAEEIGDEPMQFHVKFPQATVSVGEDRVDAIQTLTSLRPETDVVILDDAFQHRKVKAGLNILLTAYDNLFTTDHYLPAGHLRDLKQHYKKAEIIVVTKCKAGLTEEERDDIIQSISPLPEQEILFTDLQYMNPYHLLDQSAPDMDQVEEIFLLTGIAFPEQLIGHLKAKNYRISSFIFEDHHQFTRSELELILERFDQQPTPNKIILTTEKDATRLKVHSELLRGRPVFVLPVAHRFLFDGQNKFEQIVLDFVTNFGKPA
jgi:tetraacyldisaccharide 4'-kinase